MSRSFKHVITEERTHQFLVPTPEEGEKLVITVNHEGVIADVTSDDGEVIGTCYFFFDDLVEMAMENS
jgi:hypothetical protein